MRSHSFNGRRCPSPRELHARVIQDQLRDRRLQWIHRLRANGVSVLEIADRCWISTSQVYRILKQPVGNG